MTKEELEDRLSEVREELDNAENEIEEARQIIGEQEHIVQNLLDEEYEIEVVLDELAEKGE